jgi:NodT family efflux transporter outer membrane factor (OMF) lipoprotein
MRMAGGRRLECARGAGLFSKKTGPNGPTFPDPRAPGPYPLLLLLSLVLTGCMVGPNYHRPSAPVPPAFKEQPPPGYKEAQGAAWKPGQPADYQLKGKWWEVYRDPQLNAIEEMVGINNQNVLLAEAQYKEARDAVRVARAALFPTVTTAPSIIESRAAGGFTSSGAVVGGSGGGGGGSSLRTAYNFPVDVSWTVDLWGSIRRSITASADTAQAQAANLENVRLLYQTDLAVDYFSLCGLNGDIELLNRTVVSYRDYLTLTQQRFRAGVASDLDVAQAESQLYAAQTTLVDFGVARAQFEHAIAVLTGRPPAVVEIPGHILTAPPPPVPIELPSELLQRRPDIAINERQMAAANEQIGIAKAAYFPTLSLSGTAGFQSSSITTWFSWPSRFFSVGPTLAETIFDAGRRRAVEAETIAAYDATVAAYRQTVLTALQQVEDELAALRILREESATVADSVASAERALKLSDEQYRAGVTSYLTVITAQTTALAAERTQVDLLTRRLTSSVLLIQALGGGWDVTQLPTRKDVEKGTE